MSLKPGVVAGPITERDLGKLQEAVCVMTEKIYDSCKEKDCIENAPVIFNCPRRIQRLLRMAINVKLKNAEICDVYADVEPVPFKKGFYTVDVKFFITVTLDFFIPTNNACSTQIVTVTGVIVFDKKIVLFGSEGGVKIFKTHIVDDTSTDSSLQQDNLPLAVIEVADPLALTAKIVDVHKKHCCKKLPRKVSEFLERNGGSDDVEDEIDSVDDERHGNGGVGGAFTEREVLASVGIFSIVKLVRYIQLLVPAFGFCVPNKVCISSTDDDPCELFDTIDFPLDEFYPPQKFEFPGAIADEEELCGKA